MAATQTEPDQNLRLGFGIDRFEEVIQQLKALQIVFSLEPTLTEFGYMAVVYDPDRRKIELYKNEQGFV